MADEMLDHKPTDAKNQTPYGLATWLVSMDEPDSHWRPRTTMQDIIDEAKLALENERTVNFQAQYDALYSAVKEEVERYHESAAERRDAALRWKDAREAERQILLGLQDDQRANRLQAILDRSALQAGRER